MSDKDVIDAILAAGTHDDLCALLKRVTEHYHDLTCNPPERTPRETMCLHLGLISGAVMRTPVVS